MTKSSSKDEKKTKLQGAVSVSVKGIRKLDQANKDKENKEEQAVKEKSGVAVKSIHKIKNESAVTEDLKKKDGINEDRDQANRKSVSFAGKVEECVPIVKISETVTEQNIVDESLFEVDTEAETDSETEDIPLSQIKAVKAEDRMVDYKSQMSSTDEFDDGNSQESYDGDEIVMGVVVDDNGDDSDYNDDDDEDDDDTDNNDDNVTSVVFESKDDPTQMTKVVIYNYILYYIQKTIHSKLICTNVHS